MRSNRSCGSGGGSGCGAVTGAVAPISAVAISVFHAPPAPPPERYLNDTPFNGFAPMPPADAASAGRGREGERERERERERESEIEGEREMEKCIRMRHGLHVPTFAQIRAQSACGKTMPGTHLVRCRGANGAKTTDFHVENKEIAEMPEVPKLDITIFAGRRC